MVAFPIAKGLTPAVKRSKQTAAVTVGNIQGNWLPVPYPTTKVAGATGNWFWEAEGLSVRSADASISGQTYSATFLDVQPDLAQLRSASTNQTVSKSYLGLPAKLPSIITQTAKSVAGSATTDYDRALALQAYFRSDLFTYSTTAPVAQGYDGTGADVVAEFLQKKAGYCVHFASAMAIMARVLGIPSRVAVGFQAGPAHGEERSDGLHREHPRPARLAGAVLPGHRLAALRADSRPRRPAELLGSGRGRSAAHRLADRRLDGDADCHCQPIGRGRPRPADRPGEQLGQVSQRWLRRGTPGTADPARAADRGRPRPGGWARAGALAARTGDQTGRDPATNAWAEVRDTARDHGWLAPETETAREFAARLSMVLADDSDRIAGFRGHIESTAYGPPDAASLSLPELRAVRRAIAGSVSARERLRAVFLPASLLARVRFDPDA